MTPEEVTPQGKFELSIFWTVTDVPGTPLDGPNWIHGWPVAALQLNVPAPAFTTSKEGAALVAMPPQAAAVNWISIVPGWMPRVGGSGAAGPRVRVTVNETGVMPAPASIRRVWE